MRLLWLLPFLFASQSFAATCSLQGRFQQIVYDVFGKEWAEAQTAYGMAFFDEATGNLLCEEYVQPDRLLYPASSIKSLIAVALYRKIDRGQVSLDQEVAIDQVNAAAECHYWDCTRYGPGIKRKVSELLWDMITVSNNIATNQLIDVATKPWIKDTALVLGAPTLQVFRKVYDDVDPEPEIKDRNTASARGLVTLYREIATGRQRVLTPASRSEVIELLRNQKINGSLSADFPPEVIFFHKPGNTSTTTSDGGYFLVPLSPSGPATRVIAALVGLQDFNRYRVCTPSGCTWQLGFHGLKLVGGRALTLSRQLF